MYILSVVDVHTLSRDCCLLFSTGKYVVRLHFNGVWRKVVVDDRLPVSPHGELLCSHSKAKGELWVSLLEKAYLKVSAAKMACVRMYWLSTGQDTVRCRHEESGSILAV